MNTPFDIQTRLTQIAMAAVPTGMIADMVLPIVMVMAEKFAYTVFDEEDVYTVPEARIGRISHANQVEFGATDKTESTVPWGLEDPVPIRDINAARDQGANFDPLAGATERTSILVKLAHEKRVADLVFETGSYTAGNQTALATASKWDKSAATPVDDVLTALDKPLIRPNTAVFGQPAWTRFRQHSDVVDAVKSVGGSPAGVVSRQQVAAVLELDQVLVGRTFYNSARKGQSESYSYLWGKNCALLHVNQDVKSAQGTMPTFGMTAVWKALRAGTYMDEGRGAEGCEVVKVVEDCIELISFKQAGYYFPSCVS